jgi:hypothetical protein
MKIELRIQTVDELVTIIQVLAWAFVVFVVMTVFGGTVGSMLYSVIFVTQPIKSMAPIDQAFTKMLNDIVLLLTGSITTLIGMFGIAKGAKALAEKIAPAVITPSPCPPAAPAVAATTGNGMPDFNWMGWQNPALDESWRPGPPPTTAPDYLDPSRGDIAAERAAAGGEQ